MSKKWQWDRKKAKLSRCWFREQFLVNVVSTEKGACKMIMHNKQTGYKHTFVYSFVPLEHALINVYPWINSSCFHKMFIVPLSKHKLCSNAKGNCPAEWDYPNTRKAIENAGIKKLLLAKCPYFFNVLPQKRQKHKWWLCC